MTLEIDSRRIGHLRSDVEQPPATQPGTARADLDQIYGRTEHSRDAILTAAVAATRRVASSAAPEPGVLYLGLNPASAASEEAALAKSGSVRRRVGARAARQSSRARAALRHFRRGRAGKPIPSRLVLSAHSGGESLYGDAGELSFVDVQRLAACMPRAAAQVEDVHLSACSTSGQAGLASDRATWTSVFPNLKTMWAYAGSSRLTPTHDLEVWARATAQAHDDITVPTDLRGKHVAIWSKTNGYHDDVDVTAIRKRQTEADTKRFAKFMSGEITANHQTSAAADDSAVAQPADALLDYEAYRVLSQRNDIPMNERTGFAMKANQLLRIRYYDEGVRKEFATRYANQIKIGFEALGLQTPNFASLRRRAALAEIANFEARLTAATPAPPAAASLAPILRGLRDLDSNVVRESDCHHA